jgi:hypothetical protein
MSLLDLREGAAFDVDPALRYVSSDEGSVLVGDDAFGFDDFETGETPTIYGDALDWKDVYAIGMHVGSVVIGQGGDSYYNTNNGARHSNTIGAMLRVEDDY